MADDDKLINVIVKYSQTGAEQVAKTSVELTETELKAWKEANQAAVDLAGIRAKAWELGQEKIRKASEETVSKEQDNVKKLRDNYNRLTEDQLKAWSKLRPANGKIGGDEGEDSGSPEKPGGPFDPAIPRRFNQELQNTANQYRQLKRSAAELGQVGRTLTVIGGLFTGTLIAGANNYAQTVGNVSEVSAEWLGYQKDIKEANLEIGKEAATALLPAYRAAADLMKDVASVVKENPWIIQAALYAGGAATAVGAAITVVSQITKVIADIGLLLARLEASQAKAMAANAEGGFGNLEYGPGGPAGSGGSIASSIGMVTLTATSVIIGAELGTALGNWLGQLLYGETYKDQKLQDALMTFQKIFQLPWVLLAGELSKMGPKMQEFAQGIMDVINGINNFVGDVINDTPHSEADQKAADSEMVTQQQVDAFIAFQKQIASLEENYGEQRTQIVQQYAEQRAQITEQYEQQRAEIIKNYEAQVASVTAQYEANRLEAIANYEEQVASVTASHLESQARAQEAFERASERAAEDHAKQMQRMAEDHGDRLLDLAGQRDALGIVKENEAYAKKVSRAEEDYAEEQRRREEDYQIQKQQREEDYQKRLEEMAKSFEEQQAKAKEAHLAQLSQMATQEKERLAKLDEQHKKAMERLDEQEKEKLSKMEEAYNKQIEQIQTAFVDRLRALDSTILGDTAAFEAYMQQQAIEFQQWLNDFKAQQGSSSVGSSPENGSVTGTNSMSDIISSSKKFQSGLMPSFVGARGKGSSGDLRSINVTVQSRNLTLSEIKREIETSLNSKLSDLIPAFGG